MQLLERERAFADLTEWLDAAAAGGRIVLVGGEAGIGKTSLLQEFARRRTDTRLLWGACDALFTPRPFGPLHDIARQTKGGLLATLGSVTGADGIFSAALDELERVPSLAVFEDLHWADEATLDLLKYLGRRIHRTQTLLALTYRDDELGARHPLRFLIGDLPHAHTHRLSLSPLSELAVAELARRAGRVAGDLHVITRGNPLFVTEVLAVAGSDVPATVRDAVLARAQRLTPVARDLAEVVCVVPGTAERWLIESAVAQAITDPTAVEGCLSMGMVRRPDGSLGFRHEVARRALEDSLSPPRQQELHARVLAALGARPAVPAARLAHHADGARDARAVLEFAPLAARQAASVGAHREAAAQYELAVRYAEQLDAPQFVELQEKLSYECYLLGQYDRAISAQRIALQYWRASRHRIKEGDTLRSLSRLSWNAGRRAEADQYAFDAVQVLESVPPTLELARAYCNRADLAMESHEADSSLAWAERAIELATSWSSEETLSDALNVRGTMRLIGGDIGGWCDLERGLQLSLAGGHHENVASAYTNLVAMAVSRRRYAEASRYLAAALGYCEERDLVFCLPYLHAYSARMNFERGEWDSASEDIEAVLRHPRTTPVSRIPALRTLAHLRIRRGDPAARTALEEARASSGPAPELQRRGSLAAIDAEIAWLAGDRTALVQAVEPVYAELKTRRDPRMKGELAAWLWRVGALGEQPAEIAESYAFEIAGDWSAAARSWKALGCPYEHASVLGWYGGEVEQREALGILERLGASPAVQALRQRMRAQGVRGIPRGSRSSTRDNAHGLTRREAQILDLVCEGLGNPAIAKRLSLSIKTVEHHLSAILGKLGVESRAQAAAVARGTTPLAR